MADLDKVFQQHVDNFEKKVRRLQKQEFDCCSKCASDETSSKPVYDGCLQRCSSKTQRVGDAFSAEINRFQVRRLAALLPTRLAWLISVFCYHAFCSIDHVASPSPR